MSEFDTGFLDPRINFACFVLSFVIAIIAIIVS